MKLGSLEATKARKGLISRDEKKSKNVYKTSTYMLAGDPGFEPGLTESESAVLPLN